VADPAQHPRAPEMQRGPPAVGPEARARAGPYATRPLDAAREMSAKASAEAAAARRGGLELVEEDRKSVPKIPGMSHQEVVEAIGVAHWHYMTARYTEDGYDRERQRMVTRHYLAESHEARQYFYKNPQSIMIWAQRGGYPALSWHGESSTDVRPRDTAERPQQGELPRQQAGEAASSSGGLPQEVDARGVQQELSDSVALPLTVFVDLPESVDLWQIFEKEFGNFVRARGERAPGE